MVGANPRAYERRSTLPIGAMIVGGMLTVGFYAVIPLAPQQELLRRYFCSHPLEYVTTAFFFVGISILTAKLLHVTGERAAITGFAGSELQAPKTLAGAVELLANQSTLAKGRNARSQVASRVRDVCDFVRDRGSVRGLEEHLRYLAELASDRLHESYSLVRTITWAVPILGFLGTVIGITMAIANVTPEQLDSSLGEVTGGLAVAFDTTALALALSIGLVFASFVVERFEQQVLADVEQVGIRRIAPVFSTLTADDADPLLRAETQAASQLLERSEALIAEQTQLWNEQLEQLRERWMTTLQTQTESLNTRLTESTDNTVSSHAEYLAQMQAAMLTSYEQAGDRLVGRFAEMNAQVSAKIDAWKNAMQESTLASAEQMEALHSQGQMLLQFFERDDRLVRMEQDLIKNLEAVRAAETFEETLHNLTAAVHLLTARSRPKAA